MPEFLVWSNRYGWNNRPAGPWRVAKDAATVRRMVSGLRARYGNPRWGDPLEIKVYRVGDMTEVSEEFTA